MIIVFSVIYLGSENCHSVSNRYVKDDPTS